MFRYSLIFFALMSNSGLLLIFLTVILIVILVRFFISQDSQAQSTARPPQELIGSLISQSEVAERLIEKLKSPSS